MKPNFLIKPLYNRINGDGGITFTETLVSLFLLSIVMISLFRLGTTLLPSITDDSDNIFTFRKDVILRRAIENEISRIKPLWYLDEYSPLLVHDQWIFPWYQGKEENLLVLELSDKGLAIGDGNERRLLFSRVKQFDLHLLYDPLGSPIIIKVLIVLKDSRELEIYCPLGSRVTPGKDLP